MTRTSHVAVLGIDAAWTERQPSGLALIEKRGRSWRCVRVAASYAEFLGLKRAGEARCRWPGAAALLEGAARWLGGKRVAVVAADIPLALGPIRGRREADRRVSRAFGAAGCATHSPSAERPGKLAGRIRAGFEKAGLALATEATPAGTPGRLIEIYPHPALLALCERSRRLEYKASKRRTYWPGEAPGRRLDLLLDRWAVILAALHERIDGIALPLPSGRSGRELKAFEDTLDAVVSAWVGAEYLEGRASAYGDAKAAIWIPTGAERFVTRSRARDAVRV